MKLIVVIILLSLIGCTRNSRLEAPSKDIVESRLIAEDLVRSARRLWRIKQKERNGIDEIIVHQNCKECKNYYQIILKQALKKANRGELDDLAHILTLGYEKRIPVGEIPNARKLSKAMDLEFLRIQDRIREAVHPQVLAGATQ